MISEISVDELCVCVCLRRKISVTLMDGLYTLGVCVCDKWN